MIRSKVRVQNNAPAVAAQVERAKRVALREGGKAAARAWQDVMLAELAEAARDTQGGGTGRQYRALPRRSARRIEHPARQSGEFARGWRRGKVEVTPSVSGQSATIKAAIDHTDGRALEIVAHSADHFNNAEFPHEAKRELYEVFERTTRRVFAREMARS